MATKICQKCGAEFEGIRDRFYCAKCAKEIKTDVIRTRICKMCGTEFEVAQGRCTAPHVEKNAKKKQLKHTEKKAQQDQSEVLTNANGVV